MMTIDLQDKVALVIGGSRGIGGAVTEALTQAGALVAFTHTGDPERRTEVDALLARIQEKADWAEAVALDACDAAGTASLVDRIVEERGRLDILVHSVGRNLAGPAEDLAESQWRRHLDLNLTSAFIGVRAVLPPMLNAGHGRIILIGSSAVYDGGGGAIDYAAAKAGLEGMMKYLTRTYARRGILTNVVHPCVVDTDLMRERYSDPEQRRQLAEQVPVGRLGRPQDIAGLVAYLASPWGDFICGQSILVDGGRTLFR